MKKYLLSILAVFIAIFFTVNIAEAQLRTITIPQGGTGTSTKPTYGQLLMGDGSGLYILTSTSSLGISSGSSALADLTDVNLTALATGAILYWNGTDWVNLSIGTSGQVLKVNGGTPYWGTDVSGGGGSGTWATTSNNLAQYPNPSSLVTLFGQEATTTTGNIIEALGNVLFRGNLITQGRATSSSIHATSTTASSTLQNTEVNQLKVGTLSGIIKAVSGVLKNATAGVDYVQTETDPIYLADKGNILTSASSTTDLPEGTNLYYTDGRVSTYLGTIDKGYFFSTTSADWWVSTKGYLTDLLGGLNAIFGNSTTTNATTTNLAITSIPNSILATNADGTVIASSSPYFNSFTAGNGVFTGTISHSGSFNGTNATFTGGATTSNLAIDAYTAGSVLFIGPSSRVTQDNASLFWDDTNNRLGIGKTSPATALDVVGTASSTGLQVNGNSTVTGISTSTTLVATGLGTAAGTFIAADANGRLIATTTPRVFYPAFVYASSTALAGTTTLPIGPAYTAETWNSIKCFTDTGTANISIYDGTNRMNMFNASTTVGEVTLSTNNTFTSGEKRYVDIGTPASSVKQVSCSVYITR